MPLPKPEPGMVISYAYLWRRERDLGQTEGLKERPCVVVLAVETRATATVVTLAPVTHAVPRADTPAVELPHPVKVHLGLDDRPSFVILNEVNQFAWPGFDVRPVGGQGHYGFLPPKLLTRIKDGIVEAFSHHAAAIVTRGKP